jgi:hypothetical protein
MRYNPMLHRSAIHKTFRCSDNYKQPHDTQSINIHYDAEVVQCHVPILTVHSQISKLSKQV